MGGRRNVLIFDDERAANQYLPGMSVTQKDKALRFQALHQRLGAFLLPNPWDGGSARILAGLGFEALATSSAAAAGVLGRRDGRISRDEALAHAHLIVSATALPVVADLENGFGDDPVDAAETIRRAGEAGLVGASIEDSRGDTANPIYDLQHATERIAAAAEAARNCPFPFTLAARAENFVRGNPDLDDTIRRLNAFADAGADVLFAPALPDRAAVRAVCASVSKPVNFMVAIRGKSFTISDLADAGVKRISFASSLYRAAMTELVNVASALKQSSSLAYLERALPTAELNKFFPE